MVWFVGNTCNWRSLYKLKYYRLKTNITCSFLLKNIIHIYPCNIFIIYEVYTLNRMGTVWKDKLTKENSDEEHYKGRRLLSKKWDT